MKPKKMRAEMAKRFPGLEVMSASTGVGCSSVQIRGRNGLRLAVMYQQPDYRDLTPYELEKMFHGWFEPA